MNYAPYILLGLSVALLFGSIIFAVGGDYGTEFTEKDNKEL